MRTTRTCLTESGPREVALLLFLLITTSPGCSLAPPMPAIPSPGPRAYSSGAERPTFYDRYREEQHRRKVEKELRDIKRNTQRPKGDQLR